MAGVEGFEPSECQSQNLVPYRLATPQYYLQKPTNKNISLFNKRNKKMAGPAGFEPAE